MRLRRRSRRSTEASEPADPLDSWTSVGNLDSPVLVRVDPAGRAYVPRHGWLLDWWIGAEDRWHRPAQEAAVRQQLVGSSPVVETRMRIPSGDAVSYAYGARGPRGEDLLVVEVQNDSKVPFALALAVSPLEPNGALHDVGLAGSELRVDGTTVWLPRSPGRFALSTAAAERSAGEVVLAGDAEPVRSASVSCADGGAQGVLLFPLAHTAALRVAVSLDGEHRAIDPGVLPSARQVSSGWASHGDRGARIEVPDRRLRDAISASTRFLLLASDESDASLATIAARWRLAGALPPGDPITIAALVERWRAEPDALGHRALPAVAEVLDAMGEARAAEDVRAVHRERPQPSTEPDDVSARLATASPTWTWATERSGHDVTQNAALLLAVRDLLVEERREELAISPQVPDAWLGLGWEVHDLPTAFGRLSFAVRWHGERPALLWELDVPSDRRRVRLTTPALDPSWATDEARGEALLAPVRVPERPSQRRGLTIPVTIEPIRRRG